MGDADPMFEREALQLRPLARDVLLLPGRHTALGPPEGARLEGGAVVADDYGVLAAGHGFVLYTLGVWLREIIFTD